MSELNPLEKATTKYIADETIRLLKVSALDEKNAKDMYYQYLTVYLEKVISLVMLEHTEKNIDNQSKYMLTKDNYLKLKESVADSVTIAFETAINKFSGTNLEYYCTINIIPEPANKVAI